MENKYIKCFYSVKTGAILHFEDQCETEGNIVLADEVRFFKEAHPEYDFDIALKYEPRDSYQAILDKTSSTSSVVLKINPNSKEWDFNLIPTERNSKQYLWNDMNPQRPYTREQVEKIYTEDYINFNLYNTIHHSQGFEAKFLPLDKLTLNPMVLQKNWNTYFNDPYLADAEDKLELGKSILKDGTYFPIIVTCNFDYSTYAVKEGNHRIASLKLLQAQGQVPEDYKVLCIIIPRNVSYQQKINFYDLIEAEPIRGRYNIDCQWGTAHLNNNELAEKINDAIFLNEETDKIVKINDYTIELNKYTVWDMYQFIYVYPLFLRDLFYYYKDTDMIKPSPIVNNEEAFLEWYNKGFNKEETE